MIKGIVVIQYVKELTLVIPQSMLQRQVLCLQLYAIGNRQSKMSQTDWKLVSLVSHLWPNQSPLFIWDVKTSHESVQYFQTVALKRTFIFSVTEVKPLKEQLTMNDLYCKYPTKKRHVLSSNIHLMEKNCCSPHMLLLGFQHTLNLQD
jgi:hypothetical protein